MLRLLIKFPSRGRPSKLLEVVKKYIDYACYVEEMVISLDTDDETVTPEFLEALRSIHPAIQVVIGTSESKIHAVNRDIPDPDTWDIVLLASDDMIPQIKGYDQIIRERMKIHYPDTDGVLFFNDGYRGKELNTLCILGSKYYRRFGYIYYPEYKSFWCDNEFTEVADKLRKQTYIEDVIIKHENPIYLDYPNMIDSVYIRNLTFHYHDLDIYNKRRGNLYSKTEASRITSAISVSYAKLSSRLIGRK
jgi:hypothetical protein